METKEEFYAYIDSFNKKPSTYTADEIYKIGVAHKSLPQNQKSWSDLAAYIGYLGTSQSLRNFINQRQKKMAEISQLTDAMETSSDNKDFEASYKERIKNTDILNTYKACLRNEARVERFKEELFEAIKNITPIKLPTRAKLRRNKIEAILMLSDLHLGTNCDNFYNTFNYEIAKKRVFKLADETLKYCEKLHVSRLNVVNLGDLIAGNIHVNSRVDAEFNLVDQITKAAELISTFLAHLTQSGMDITYRSCTDNHSRSIANKEDNIEAENFNRIIDWYIACRLKNTDIAFINDNIDISLGKFDLLNGKKVMFAHGHLENINKCIDAFCGATKEFIDYVLLSHFHTSKEKSYNGGKVIVNGSIVGTEQYALSRRLFSPAEQKLLVFDNDNLIDVSINLQINN